MNSRNLSVWLKFVGIQTALSLFIRPDPTFASPIGNAQHIEERQSTASCAGSDWDLTWDNWNAANTDEWLEMYTQNLNGTNLLDALLADYLPTDRAFECGIPDNDGCYVADCTEIVNYENGGKQAYFVLNSISHWSQTMSQQYNALSLVYTQANSEGLTIVNTFQISGQIPSSSDSTGLLKQLLNAFVAVVSIAASYYALPGIGSAVSILASPTKAAQYVTNGILDAVSETLSEPTSDTAQATLNALDNYDAYLYNNLNSTMTSISSLTNVLLSGGSDGTGANLQSYISNGTFLDEPSESGELEAQNYITQQVLVGGINAVWKTNLVYIVAQPAINNDCEGDNLQPSSIKFCRENDNNVYYAFMISNAGSPPWVKEPTGYMSLSNYNTTMQHVIESSIKAYWAAGFNYENVRTARWTAAQNGYFGAGQKPTDLWDKFEGSSMIPVCYDPSGITAKTGLDNGTDIIYPCSCGYGNRGEETGAFRAALGLQNNAAYISKCQGSGDKYNPGNSHA